jgi:hypothetical protein
MCSTRGRSAAHCAVTKQHRREGANGKLRKGCLRGIASLYFHGAFISWRARPPAE